MGGLRVNPRIDRTGRYRNLTGPPCEIRRRVDPFRMQIRHRIAAARPRSERPRRSRDVSIYSSYGLPSSAGCVFRMPCPVSAARRRTVGMFFATPRFFPELAKRLMPIDASPTDSNDRQSPRTSRDLAIGHSSACDSNRQCLVALDKTRIDPLRFAGHLDLVEAFQHLFPDDPKLEFGQPQADAAMNAEAE
jgi:hypothetical protein